MSEEVYSDKAPARPGEWVFRDYTTFLSPWQARAVLLGLAGVLLIGEVGLRLRPPSYERSTQNSMIGIREQILNLTTDSRPKVIAVGDSSFVGVGVKNTSKTTIGLVRSYFGGQANVANLSLPAGDNRSSLMILSSLKTLGVTNVKDIIIEVMRAKLNEPPELESESYVDTALELERYDPFTPTDLTNRRLTRQEEVESYLEWRLSQVSCIYRYKDYVRNHQIGLYPSFYVVGKVTPRPLLKKLFGPKGDGNNRLSAQVDDRPYAISDGAEGGVARTFSQGDETKYFERTLQAAQELHPERIIVVEVPEHYTYSPLTSTQIQDRLRSLSEADQFIKSVCTAKNVTVVNVDSSKFQDPVLWTRTVPHFREALHNEVFLEMKPYL